MDRVKILGEWVTKRLFPISIVIFVLIYFWWFRLTPWNPQEGCCSNVDYKLGLFLLFFYVGSGIFWSLTKNRNRLGIFFRVTTIFFFIISSWYTAVFMPRLIDAAKYNGTMYYLVSYPESPDTSWRRDHQLTKWYGTFNYEIHYMDKWASQLFYDPKTELVSTTTVFNDRAQLLFTDDTPARCYDHYVAKLGNFLYYVSMKYGDCATGPYTMYKCELDNTSCAILPFRYTGSGEFAYLEINEKNKEVDFYVWLASEGKFVAYSYGEQPRCYVEGCEILESTK